MALVGHVRQRPEVSLGAITWQRTQVQLWLDSDQSCRCDERDIIVSVRVKDYSSCVLGDRPSGR